MPQNLHFSSPGEQFLSLLSSSSWGVPCTSPSQNPRCSCNTTWAGPHSPNCCCTLHAPAGNKQCKYANNTQTFYTKEKEFHVCLFCMSVLLYPVSLIYFLWHVCRGKHALNPQYMVTQYGKNTSTTIYQKHLCESHLGAWITTCDKLSIDITAKSAQNTIQNYPKQHNQVSSADEPEDLWKRFTPGAFVNAIVDLIVSNDQIKSFYCTFIVKYWLWSEY